MRSIRYILIAVMFSFMFSISAYALDDPIAYWKMDDAEGEIATEEFGNLDGTLVGSAFWLPEDGLYGGALECIDDSGFVTIPGSDGIFDDLGTQFTFSVWIKVYEFTADWQGIIFKNDVFFFERNNSGGNGTVNSIHLKCKDDTGAQPFNLYGDILIDDGEWHHVVGIYDTDAAYLYIDNQLDKEGPGSGEMIGYVEDPLVIGAKVEGDYRNSWNGLIDDVRIYDIAMTAEQVDELYHLEIDTKVASKAVVANDYILDQNYPNPFNPSTRISFTLPKHAHVSLDVYNTLGQRVKTLMDQSLSMGVHQAVWDGTNDSGEAVTNGLYFYSLRSELGVQTRKMMFMK
jgi:hypothetical protein